MRKLKKNSYLNIRNKKVSDADRGKKKNIWKIVIIKAKKFQLFNWYC